MRKILLSAAAAASLFALPAFAQSAAGQLSSDADIRYWQEYRSLIDKANDYRLAHEQGAPAVTESGATAAIHSPVGVSATDASQATESRSVGPQPAVGAGGHYNTIQDYWQDR